MTARRKISADPESVQRLLSRLPRQAANREFRDRLRSQFVRDTIPGRVPSLPHTWWSKRWGMTAVAASSAAGILAIAWLLNAGPAWKLTGSSGSGVVQIDGTPEGGLPLSVVVDLSISSTPGTGIRSIFMAPAEPDAAGIELTLGEEVAARAFHLGLMKAIGFRGDMQEMVTGSVPARPTPRQEPRAAMVQPRHGEPWRPANGPGSGAHSAAQLRRLLEQAAIAGSAASVHLNPAHPVPPQLPRGAGETPPR